MVKVGQVVPFEHGGVHALEHRYALSWTGLTHTVQLQQKDTKVILNNVFGHCEPGQMMAIMGPSGCGKTTLLDLLGDRVSSGNLEGTIRIGDSVRDPVSARKIVSYVMQEDALLTAFTVGETLGYTARLTMASQTAGDRNRRIAEVLEQMGLTAAADTRVGDPLIKGLSGGQKRRLSIAMELLQGSPILLLDEPTSGLDSAAAMQVVDSLSSVARKGHTIIMSIHQASTKSYNMFDSLYLLSRGHQVYFGPTGRAPIEHFASQGHKCPEYTNPAEFFLDILNTDFNGGSVEQVKNLAAAYQASELGRKLLKGPTEGQSDPKAVSSLLDDAGQFRQFFVLLHRMLNMNWKNPYIFAVRIVMYMALAIMVGTMYAGVGTDAREDPGAHGVYAARSLLPLLFYVQAFLVFMSVAILPFFLEQRDVFRRERANGQITCLPYVVADFLAGLPGVTLIAVISSILVVYIADLNGFGGFLLNLLLSLIVAESLMHVIGAAQPHYIIGMAFGAGLFGMFMLCEGFMVPPDDIPAGWLWGYYIAFHTYSFEWFLHNQFDGPDGGIAGATLLEQYDAENVDPARNACILVGYALLFEIMFFLVLYKFHTGRR